ITGLASEGGLTVEPKDGAEEVPNPAGADLWEAETTGSGTVSLDWDAEANRTGFLIVGSGQPGEVSSVTLSWPSNAATPWAIPLMIGGGVIFLIGLVLLFLGRRTAKREADRRQARQDRRRKLAEYGT
ncbi:hypothetical protein DN508_36385, partial [Burkholderia multivorans]